MVASPPTSSWPSHTASIGSARLPSRRRSAAGIYPGNTRCRTSRLTGAFPSVFPNNSCRRCRTGRRCSPHIAQPAHHIDAVTQRDTAVVTPSSAKWWHRLPLPRGQVIQPAVVQRPASHVSILADRDMTVSVSCLHCSIGRRCSQQQQCSFNRPTRQRPGHDISPGRR